MRIGIDIRPFGFLKDKAGIYQYIYNLVSNLLDIDLHNQYVLFSSLKGFPGDSHISDRMIRIFPGKISRPLLENLSIPIDFFIGKVDVFHGPDYFVPNTILGKSIVTIHDLMVFTHPEFLKTEWVVSIKKRILASIKRARLIIAVSNFTKNEIVNLFNIPENRVRVVYNGIAPIFRPINDHLKIKELKAKYGINGPYLLSVGNLEPKKNIETLIKACCVLREMTEFKYPLVIVGKKSSYFKKVWDHVVKFHAEKDTIFTDMVDGKDLPYLYGGAELFLFPSLMEGFGIPVIEAMACGIPVITSNCASIPEIAGDAAVLIDPLKADEIAEAIHQVLFTPSLREKLITHGRERAKLFSWEKTARETLAVYQEVGEKY